MKVTVGVVVYPEPPLVMVTSVTWPLAMVATAVALYLFFHRAAFAATVDRLSTRRGLATLAGAAAWSVLAGAAGISIGTMLSRTTHHRRMPFPRALTAAAERLIGLHTVTLPDRVGDFFTPAMMAVSLTLVLAAAYLFRLHAVRRLGGVTGDVFGALIESATAVTLIGVALR